MTERDSILAGGFDAATYDDWRKLAEPDRHGRGFGRLVSRTLSGLEIQPIYPRAKEPDAQPAPARAGAWAIVQRIDHPDPADANAQMRADLAGGANEFELVFNASTIARGAGIAIEDIHGMARLLKGIDLEAVPLRICAGHECRHVVALLAAHAQDRGADLSRMTVRLSFDAITDLAVHGFLNFSLGRAYERASDLDAGLRGFGLHVQMPTPDGRHWHAAGASDEQEIAFIVSSALVHIRGLVEAGTPLSSIVAQTGFTVAADADQFATMAKIRALRRVWARVVQAMGLEARPVHIHAETGWRMMSRRDPHMNLLRGTMAAFAAGVAGADSITVLPYTAAVGLPDPFARRMARNTQTILIEEANAHRVADPAAGSGAFEALTDAMARGAWAILQELEKVGGLLEGLQGGRVQEMVGETRERLLNRARRLEMAMIGVTAYPNLKERPVEVLPAEPAQVQSSNLRLKLPAPGSGSLFSALIEAARAGVTLADMSLSRAPQPQSLPEAMTPLRLSEPFEVLREASDDALEHSGARPHMFVAGTGGAAPEARRRAWLERAMAACGIVVAGKTGKGDDAALTVALRETGASIAALCPDDEADDETIAATAKALRGAGARAVIVVRGKASEADALEDTKGVVVAWPGCDAVAAMTRALEAAGFGPGAELVGMDRGAQA